MERGHRAKWVVVVAVALGLLVIALYPRREPAERTEALRPPVSTLDPPVGAKTGAAPTPSTPATPSSSAGPAPSPASIGQRAHGPIDARAAARRQRVLDSLAQGAPAPARAGTSEEAPGGAGGSKARVYPEGTMADKTGDFGPEVAVLNRDFIPLVEECFDQAHARNPRLGGMLALNVSLAHAEGVGGIIESVEPGPGNQVRDPEMLECVRQSAFSVELPEPKRSGRNQRFLTIPLGPPPADAGTAP